MATITPTLRLISNPSGGPAPAGPLSIALNLSRTDALTVGSDVSSGVAQVTATHTDNQIYTVGTTAAYIYLNNSSDTTIYAGSTGAAATRFLMLKAGEMSWMSWAGDQDIYLYHTAGAVVKDCEFWVFYQ
jgi:hypothetical protein